MALKNLTKNKGCSNIAFIKRNCLVIRNQAGETRARGRTGTAAVSFVCSYRAGETRARGRTGTHAQRSCRPAHAGETRARGRTGTLASMAEGRVRGGRLARAGEPARNARRSFRLSRWGDSRARANRHFARCIRCRHELGETRARGRTGTAQKTATPFPEWRLCSSAVFAGRSEVIYMKPDVAGPVFRDTHGLSPTSRKMVCQSRV